MKQKKKIIVLADFLFPTFLGGSARFATDLNESLVETGADVVCVTRPASGVYGSNLSQNYNFKVYFLKWQKIVSFFKIILRDKYQTVISHHYLFGLVSIFIFCRGKTIYFFHGPIAGESRARGCGFLSQYIKKCLESIVLLNADEIYCLSEHMAKRVPGRYREKIKITGPLNRLAIPDWLPPKKDDGCVLNLLTVRRLTPRTGVLELAEMVASVRNVQLTIIGKGELYGRIANIQVENIKVLKNVSEEELEVAYKSADLTVLPSRELEGFGLIIVESLLRGTPVLASNLAGGGADFLGGLSEKFIYDLNITGEQFVETVMEAIREFNREDVRERILSRLRRYSMYEFARAMANVS